MRKENTAFIIPMLVPPVMQAILWLSAGSSGESNITAMVYYIQLVMTAVTITSIPLLLKYVTPGRCGGRYRSYCHMRMYIFMFVSLLNIIIYNIFIPVSTFFYLGVITWLAMFFAFPLKEKAHDTDPA